MRWFCLQHSKELEITPSSKSSTPWPSATERIHAAQSAAHGGQAWIAPHSAPQNSTVRYCIHPQVALAFLEQHEDCRRDDDTATTTKACWLLHKPAKPHHLLLRHALTNANGDDWRRQRPLVAKALNQHAKQIQSVVRETASATMLRCCGKTSRSLDMRTVALTVAIETMSVAVVANATPRLHTALRALFDPTLLPLRATTAASQELYSIVTGIVNELQEQLARREQQPCCIAVSLLEQIDTAGGLTLDEVVSNIHSALMAGIQTLSTTLTTSTILLLQQTDASISSHKLCHHALRLLPPVASLPRQCPHPAKATTTFLVDLLALAHAGDAPHPWGLGDRSCPAGSLSVAGVTAALDALRQRSIVLRPTNSSSPTHDFTKDVGWMDAYGISYRPTLTFGTAVDLTLQEPME